MYIPNELINYILSFRIIHPVAKLFCCHKCDDINYLRIIKTKIICDNCIYYDNKE